MAAQRPSEYNLARTTSAGRPEWPALELDFSAEEGGVDVYYVDLKRDASGTPISGEKRFEARLLNVTEGWLTIWPINTRQDKPDFLLPKYGTLECIALARQVARPYELPDSETAARELIEGLPEGFAKQFEFGLGLHWEYRFICEAIAEHPGIDTLMIHGEGGRDDAYVNGSMFVLGIRRFHELRRGLGRIAARYQREALSDKRLLVYEDLLHGVDSKAFPAKAKTLRPNTLVELTSAAKKTQLSRQDQYAAVRLVSDHAEKLAKQEPTALLKLKSDIELVTLRELIETLESMLDKSLPESKWQYFLLSNPFVLSMALAVPAMIVQDNAFIGGTRLNRSGGKFADFLFATASTGNLALIEIKKPDTPLLAKTPYRDNVYSISADIGGAIAQILDQRMKLQKSIAGLKEESNRHDIHAFAVRCVVVAGTIPKDIDLQKSFELLRNALSDVVIITFDELLGRLREIYSALAPANTSSADDVPF